MDKPIKPKRPAKPRLAEPRTYLSEQYKLVSESGTHKLKLLSVKEVGENSCIQSVVKIPDLLAAIADIGLESQYLQLKAEFIEDLTLYYRKPLDADALKKQQYDHQLAKQQAEQNYQNELKVYEQATRDYALKLAEYNVWLAEQELQKLAPKPQPLPPNYSNQRILDA